MTIKDDLLQKLESAGYSKSFTISKTGCPTYIIGVSSTGSLQVHSSAASVLSQCNMNVKILQDGTVKVILTPKNGSGLVIGTETPVNASAILSEVEGAISTIEAIASKRNATERDNSANTKMQQDINSLNQQLALARTKAQELSEVANSRPIEETVRSLSPKQKSHILLKLWIAKDRESKEIVTTILKAGFDPHYINKDGASLVAFALTQSDILLFDLLIDNNIDLNYIFCGKSVCQLVLDSKNTTLIDKVFRSNQDLTKSFLVMCINDYDESVEAMLSEKPELASITIYGEPLIHSLLEKGKYKTVEKILKIPGVIDQLNSKGFSPVASTILKGNKEAADFLKSNGADFNEEVKNAVTDDNIKYLFKIIESYPELVNESYDGLPVGHFVLNNGTNSLLSELVKYVPGVRSLVDKNGNDLIDFALLSSKDVEAKLLMDNPIAYFTKAVEQNNIDIATKIIALEEGLLSTLMSLSYTEIMQGLLANKNILYLEGKDGDSILHLACKMGNQEIINAILEKLPGLIDKQNIFGKTPLHTLLEGDFDNVTKQQISNTILALHPDVNLEDLDHHTSVDVAMNNAEILSVFYKHGLLGVESDLA